ncbi:MAG: hypothetical protein IJJ85_05885 [Clostridia bacterium]|nr:hypothetical protein [Clostridia bacterium]
MTKAEALYAYFSGFGLPAFEESALYPETPPETPYLTYERVDGRLCDGATPFSFTVHGRDTSLAQCEEIVKEVGETLSGGGCVLPCDEGYIWLLPGAPLMQLAPDADDPRVKRTVFHAVAEFLTN